jgi:YVTN family beta-propeller protein
MRGIKLAAATGCAAALLAPAAAHAGVSRSIHIGGQNPWGVAVDSQTGNVYVSDRGSASVSVYSERLHKVTRVIGVGQDPEGIAVNANTGRVYVANFGSDSVSVINANGRPQRVIDTIQNVGVDPNSVAVDPTRDLVYVGTYMSSTVDVISGVSDKPAAKISIPGANIHDVVVNPTTGAVYASAYNLNYVAEIDLQATRPTGRLAPYCGADGLAFDPTRNILSVAQNACNWSVAGLHVSGPHGVTLTGRAITQSRTAPAYLAELPGSYVLASVPTNDTVEEISGHTIVNTFRVGPSPEMLDVDTNTKEVFVADFGSDTISEFQG